MDLLNLAFITPLALMSFDYSKEAGEIIFAVDANLERWEEMLM